MSCLNNSEEADLLVLTVVQGEDETFEIAVTDANDLAYDLTGAKIYFTVRKTWKSATAIIEKKTLNAGGTDAQILMMTPQTGATKGKAQIYIIPADTTVLTNDEVDEGTYVYDVWIVTAAGKRKVVRSTQTFVVEPRITTVP